MVRFLFVNLPLSSHINPTPGLVRELTQKGHHVTYVLAKEYHERLEGTGATLISYDKYDSEWSEARRILIGFERAYNTAKRIGQENDFDALVHEGFFIFANKLAKELNLPRIRLFSTFAFNENVLNRMFETGGKHLKTLKKSHPMNIFLTGYFDFFKGMMETSDLLNETTQNVPDLNIAYTSKNFQYLSEQFDDERFYYVGPPIEEDRIKKAKFNWDDMRRPIIYIAFGTRVDRFSKSIFQACFDALGEIDATIIASVGKLVDKFNDLPDNVQVYSRVAQIHLLRHVDLFITHGGMNSVNEAIHAGVPMLVHPIINDEMVVAEQIERLELGKRLNLKEATPHEIRTTAFNILNSEIIKERMKEESEIMHSLGGNKKAAELILEYMDTIQGGQ